MKKLIARCLGRGGGEGRWGGMEGEWGGRYSGIRAGSGEFFCLFLEETGRRDVGGGRGYRKCNSGRVVIGQCGTHWLF